MLMLKLIDGLFRKFKIYTYVQITCTFVNVKAAITERLTVMLSVQPFGVKYRQMQLQEFKLY